jgi:hypothetical protein
MSLDQMENLTKTLIARGYLPQPRSWFRQAEYAERCELLVMSTLYILGTGTGFCLIYSLTHISATEIENFFHRFLDIFIDMRDEYICMLPNLTEFTQISKWYSAVGLPGACGSMDVAHVKWSICLAGDHNQCRRRRDIQRLGFSA